MKKKEMKSLTIGDITYEITDASARNDVEILKSNDTNLQNEIAVERARINAFNSLPNGSTTGDAELMDIRIGADGTVYESAGEAVREQDKQLSEDLNLLAQLQLLKIRYDVLDGDFAGNVLHYKRSNILAVKDLYRIISAPRNAGVLSCVPITENGDGTYTYGNVITINNGQQLQEKDVTNFVKSKVLTDYIGFVGYTTNTDAINAFGDWFILYGNTELNKRIENVEKGNLLSFEGLANHISEHNLCSPLLDVNGIVSSSGTLINPTATKERSSNFIELDSDTYTFFGWVYSDNELWNAYCFYDENYNQIGSRVTSTSVSEKTDEYSAFVTTINFPSNAKYLRISARTYGSAYFALTRGNVGLVTLEDVKYQQSQIDKNEKYVNSVVDDKFNDYSLVRFIEMESNVKSVAHRGYSNIAPENTLSAFRLAKEKGFMFVETDVRETSDGVLVCLHDDTVDRTSNGSGKIKEMTFEQVRALDFGSWKSSIYAGEKIPSFDEFLELCKKLGLKAYVEIKDGSLISQIIELVKRKGMTNNVTWIINYLPYADTIISLLSKTRIEFLGVSTDILNWCIDKKDDIESVFYMTSFNQSDSNVQSIIDNGFAVNYACETKDAILNMDSYISEITTGGVMASITLYKNNIQ